MAFGRTGILFLLLFSVILPCAAQLQPVYPFQKDDAALKKIYYDQSARKKQALLGAVEKKNAADYKKIYEEQFKEINSLWETDRSVTAPPAHDYLQAIVRKIVAANHELNKTDARVVFSRDWWPNAYSMGDGTIAINAGLMVFLDNEAELVFVLCHELAHYYLDHTGHSIKKYVETINSDEFQKELKRLSKTTYGTNKKLEALTKSFAFNNRRHTRENEAAADRLAFSFMKKTGYDCNAIRSCLKLLDKIDDSLLHKPLALQQVLNFDEYPFKKKWIQKESAIFSQLDDNDSSQEKSEEDSLKTHPDCNKRIALLHDSILSMPARGQEFLVNENLFKQLKKDFFIEMTEQSYRDENLSRNLYYSLLLLQSGEHMPVAVYSVARCFNRIYVDQKNHRLGANLDAESKTRKEDYNLLVRMLGKLRLEEIADLNYHFCKKYEPLMKDYSGFAEEMKKAQNFKN